MAVHSGVSSLLARRMTLTSLMGTMLPVSFFFASSGNFPNQTIGVQFTLDQIDVMTRLQAAYPSHFSEKVDSSNAFEAFKKGQLISPFGIEGLHQIGNKAANLRKFYELGVRYATLTHNCHNKFADAAVLENPTRKAEPLWGGVSPLGRRLVHEMNRIGMIVDLSHVRYVASISYIQINF